MNGSFQVCFEPNDGERAFWHDVPNGIRIPSSPELEAIAAAVEAKVRDQIKAERGEGREGEQD